ncbi:MAG: ATP-binding protein [Pseudomonadales bacterium]|nr:ATP-binding protein [Pseudomonadales bacterium]
MTTPTDDGSLDETRRSGPLRQDLLYRSLFEHGLVEVHIWEVVRDGRGEIQSWKLMDANGPALTSWGYRLDEVAGKTAEEIFPGSDVIERFRPVVEEILATGRPREWEEEFPATGQTLRMVSFPVGEYFVSTGFDVSLARTREHQLRDTLESLNEATKAGGVGLWDWDLLTDEVRYSDEWKAQLGYAPGEIEHVFEEWRSRVHPDDLAPTLERIDAKIRNPEAPYRVVFRMQHKEGTYRWILAQASVVTDDSGNPVRMRGSHIDITDRKRLEDRVAESERLESIGTLAAGIAHDFNNLLAAITGNLSLAHEIPAEDPELREVLRDVEDAAIRAQGLTHQLMTFAKGATPNRQVSDLRDLLLDSARFVTRGTRAECRFDVAENLHRVDGDLGQLSQVINNLVINAVQAMPSGGTIRITAGNVTLSHQNEFELQGGEYVRIAVADEGIGIPEEMLAKIFDPFFSTKETGTGLGLSTSFSIVAAHNGRIRVHSRQGIGTTFEILLPGVKALPAKAGHPEVLRGAGRLLVLDDDEALRVLLQRMLQRLGYACDVARDVEEAVRMYRQEQDRGQRYDAVILDLTLPGREGGPEALRRLLAVDPNVAGIIASGYTENAILAEYRTHGFRGRLRKPMDMASLSAELHRVLGT